jgi:hypothetical protein
MTVARDEGVSERQDTEERERGAELRNEPFSGAKSTDRHLVVVSLRRRRVPLDRRFGSVPLRHPDLRCNLPHPGPAVLAVSISIVRLETPYCAQLVESKWQCGGERGNPAR